MENENKGVSAPFKAELNRIVEPPIMDAMRKLIASDAYSPIYVRKTSLKGNKWKIEFRDTPARGFADLDCLDPDPSDQTISARSQQEREDICFVLCEHNETIRQVIEELAPKGRKSFTGDLVEMTKKRHRNAMKLAMTKMRAAGITIEEVVSKLSTEDAEAYRALCDDQNHPQQENLAVC